MDVAPEFDARLGRGEVSLTGKDRELLVAIADAGSINGAAAATGRSYAHAQRRIVTLEEAFGPLVERRRGGAAGGGSTLTDNARALLARLDRLRASFAGVAESEETVLQGEVVDCDGELATVETPAGRVRVVTVGESAAGDAVQVAIRADTVTLNRPADAPEPEGTSARNQFRGSVTDIERGESLALVRLDVGVETDLAAVVTRDSIAKLDIDPGSTVVASFKATATRAVPTPE
jgi:molybdate transport system regulatory protein